MENTVKKPSFGLNGFQLKMIALILMVFDHLRHIFDIFPDWFRIVGRLSAPIFIFLLAEGFYHTRNKKKHILTMFLFSVLVLVGNTFVERTFPIGENVIYLMNNIFLTFTVSMCIMYFGDNIKNKKNVFLSVIMVVLFSLMSIFVEGSFIFVGIGVMFYFLRDKKKLKFALYVLISLLLGLMPALTGQASLGATITSMITFESYQWFMVFSVIFMLLYNSERGPKGNKYFFYIFYPTHLWVMYMIKFIFKI